MRLQQVSDSCFAALNDRNRMCDANSGLINLGDGVVIDTQADLFHARRMIELFGKVWSGMPKYVVNTCEDGDHVSGNQLFAEAEIIAQRTVAERMRQVAQPLATQRLLESAERFVSRLKLKATHPGALAAARQLHGEHDFAGIELRLPTTVFDAQYAIDLDGSKVQLIYVGPCHQAGDTIVYVAKERVLFSGDVIFRQCSPIEPTGSYAKWLEVLNYIIAIDPEVIVPGHGPACGLEGAMEMKAYVEYVLEESRRFFERGMSAEEAARRIDLGPYAGWNAPARLYLNVERAYREFRDDVIEAPPNLVAAFDAVYRLARARGLKVEF